MYDGIISKYKFLCVIIITSQIRQPICDAGMLHFSNQIFCRSVLAGIFFNEKPSLELEHSGAAQCHFLIFIQESIGLFSFPLHLLFLFCFKAYFIINQQGRILMKNILGWNTNLWWAYVRAKCSWNGIFFQCPLLMWLKLIFTEMCLCSHETKKKATVYLTLIKYYAKYKLYTLLTSQIREDSITTGTLLLFFHIFRVFASTGNLFIEKPSFIEFLQVGTEQVDILFLHKTTAWYRYKMK